VLAGGDFDKHADVLGTPTTTASFLEPKSGFELARHDDAGTTCFPDIRFGNSLAQAEIHGILPAADR
jgi:hypothetical protein